MLVKILEPLVTDCMVIVWDCMVLKKLVNLSESQFSHLQIKNNNIYL